MPSALYGERLEPRQLMSINAPEAVDLLALSGGGFKAMVGDAGMFAGVMKQRGIDVATLLHDDLAISANSGSTWFTNLLGYSESFVSSLNDYERLFSTDGVTDMTVGGEDGFFGVMGEAYRGYLNQHLDAGFENVLADFRSDVEAIDDLGDLAEFLTQSPRNLGRLFIAGLYDAGSSLVEVLDDKLSGAPGYSDLRDNLLDLFSSYDFKGLLGVASVALLDGLDWNTFMQRTVFAPDQVDRVLQGVNFYDGEGRTNALATQSLIYELALSSDEATVAPEGTSLGSDIVKVSVKNDEAKYGSLPERVYNFLPATATSRGKPDDVAAPWLPNIPSGDLQVEYDSTGLFNDENRTFTDLDFSGLSAFLASSVSSSAAALSGSYGVLSDFDSVLGGIFNLLDIASSSVFMGKISDVILDYTKGLAPLVQATQRQDGSWRAGDPSYVGFNFADPIDTTSNEAAANAGWLRMADGGYFDNSSVTSGLSYLEANQNSWVADDGNKDFAITLFVFSGIGETVSDTLRSRGFDDIGNVTQRLFTGGTQQEFKIPVIGGDLVDVSHPNSAVFDSTRATGVGSPIWSYAAPANTPASGAGFELKAYTMGVETVANNTMNIGAGYQGTVHLWNVISKTGPIPLDNLGPIPVFGQWSDYEVMYEQIIDALQSGGNGVTGAGLLATQLGINTAPTSITLSSAAIAENESIGTVVGTLGTVDADAGDTFTYTLVSGEGSTDNASFTIDGTSLKAAASFDFETRSSYSVRVGATDSGGLTTERAFTITVTDVNDNAPVFTSGTTGTVAENAPTATAIYTATTSDADGTPANRAVTYSIKPSVDDADLVEIDAVTGVVTLKASADFEAKADYQFTVIAAQDGISSVETQVIVQVTDVNEAPAVVTPPVFRLIAGRAGDLQWPAEVTSFSDPDLDPLTVTLRVPDGAFAATSTAEVTVGGAETARTFTGTPTAINAYFSSLGSIRYTPAVGNPVVEMAIEVFDGELTAETAVDLLVAQLINRPELRRSTTVRLGGGTMGPQPIAFNYTDLLGASVSTPQQGTRFLVSSVVDGTVEKWDGSRWVNILTPITSGSPTEVLRQMAFRLIGPHDLVRWTPPPSPGRSLTAFRILGWDGQQASDGPGDIDFSL
jgi:hypothetical protein